jgi:Rod binding domain-containing protein
MIHAMNATTGTSSQSEASSLLNKQLTKRATEFEAMMLEQLIAPVQKSFTSIGGDGEDAGKDTISGLGTQFLAQGMAEQGGIGLAKMVMKSLSAKDSK